MPSSSPAPRAASPGSTRRSTPSGCSIPACRLEVLRPDGSDAARGDTIARVEASARALLAAERTALNLLGHLSGVATATRDVVARLAGLPTRVACTRKTTPGLRALEKHAVRAGGGTSHRYGLDDAVLIKDNHVALAGGVAPAIARVRASVSHLVKVELEVDTLAQLDEALALGVDAVLLDNMDLATLREAVRRAKGRALTEASGGIRPDTRARGRRDGRRPRLARLADPQRAVARRRARRRGLT